MSDCVFVRKCILYLVCVYIKRIEKPTKEREKRMENCVEIAHTHTKRETENISETATATVQPQQRFECWHEGTLYAQVNKWFFDGFKHISTRILPSVRAIRVCLFLFHGVQLSKYFLFCLVCVCVCVCTYVSMSVCIFTSHLHYDKLDPANSLKIFTFSEWWWRIK